MARPIHVRPAPALRRDFARWATGQSPRIRTRSESEFAVPADLFVLAPEEYLLGALVDGHRYVSPLEDEDQEQAGAEGTPDLPELEAAPGEPLPDLPESAYGPAAVPLDPPVFAPLDDAPADEEQADAPHVCGTCGNPYATARGLATHRRAKHPEE